jgi:putative peptidoglycan lipid II flippase
MTAVEPEDPSPSLDSGGQLLRSSAVVAVGTGLSRVTGLARTVAQGIVLGTIVGSTYSGANTVPNLLYDLLLGGVLAATLVPVFVENRERHDDDATSAVVTVLGLALVVVTGIALLLAPVLAVFFTPVVPPEGADAARTVTTLLLVMFLPQIFFYGVTTLFSGLLNAHRRFAAAAFAPVVNNIITIAVLVVFSARVGTDPTLDDLHANTWLLVLLGLGTTLGIAAQTVVLVPAIRQAHITLRWRFDVHSRAVRAVVRLSGWTFGYVLANVATVGVIIVFAEKSDQSSFSAAAYNYAYQFFQLPYGLLAVSVITAFLPELTRLALGGQLVAFGERFMLGLRITLLLVVPVTAGYLVLARPIMALFFNYRSLDQADTNLIGNTLITFTIGLPAFAIYLLSMRGFYAFKDTRTPFFINLGECALTLVLAIVLRSSGAPGLALAFALGYVPFAVVALVLLHRKAGGLPWATSVPSLVRITGAGLVTAALVAGVSLLLGSEEGSGALVRVVAGVAVGAAAYVGTCLVLRVPELRQGLALVRRPG